MKKTWLIWLITAFTIAGTGCGSSNTTFRSGSGAIYAPTKSEEVLVFRSKEDVKRPYEVIGEITVAGSSGWGENEGDLIKKARKNAAKLGANAIIVGALDKGSTGDRVTSAIFGTEDKSQHATAIRFTK